MPWKLILGLIQSPILQVLLKVLGKKGLAKQIKKGLFKFPLQHVSKRLLR